MQKKSSVSPHARSFVVSENIHWMTYGPLVLGFAFFCALAVGFTFFPSKSNPANSLVQLIAAPVVFLLALNLTLNALVKLVWTRKRAVLTETSLTHWDIYGTTEIQLKDVQAYWFTNFTGADFLPEYLFISHGHPDNLTLTYLDITGLYDGEMSLKSSFNAPMNLPEKSSQASQLYNFSREGNWYVFRQFRFLRWLLRGAR
jgi:hypothetical protein